MSKSLEDVIGPEDEHNINADKQPDKQPDRRALILGATGLAVLGMALGLNANKIAELQDTREENERKLNDWRHIVNTMIDVGDLVAQNGAQGLIVTQAGLREMFKQRDIDMTVRELNPMSDYADRIVAVNDALVEGQKRTLHKEDSNNGLQEAHELLTKELGTPYTFLTFLANAERFGVNSADVAGLCGQYLELMRLTYDPKERQEKPAKRNKYDQEVRNKLGQLLNAQPYKRLVIVQFKPQSR